MDATPKEDIDNPRVRGAGETLRDIKDYAMELAFKDNNSFIEYISGKLVCDVGSGHGGLFKDSLLKNVPTKIISVNPRLAIPSFRERQVLANRMWVLGNLHLSPEDAEKVQKRHDEKSAVAGYADQLPFKNGIFDIVLDCHGAIAYCEDGDIEIIINEYLRVLKPGGKIRLNIPQYGKIGAGKLKILKGMGLNLTVINSNREDPLGRYKKIVEIVRAGEGN